MLWRKRLRNNNGVEKWDHVVDIWDQLIYAVNYELFITVNINGLIMNLKMIHDLTKAIGENFQEAKHFRERIKWRTSESTELTLTTNDQNFKRSSMTWKRIALYKHLLNESHWNVASIAILNSICTRFLSNCKHCYNNNYTLRNYQPQFWDISIFNIKGQD